MPTSMGGDSNAGPPPVGTPVPQPLAIVPAMPADFPVPLKQDALAMVEQRVAGMSISTVTLQQIATMESAPEQALNTVLDGFLGKIDMFDNPQLFQLVRKLGDAVTAENLPALADRILDHQPGAMEKLGMLLRSQKARQKALDKAWEETQNIVRGTSSGLVKVIRDMENQLVQEQNKLVGELATMEQLKQNYRDLFEDYAISVAFLILFLQKAKAELEAQAQAADPNDPVAQSALMEAQDKVQALESRAISMEGSLTRLPADAMVIRQLQAAGISTLQETTTTAMARFNSIKQTLVTLNAAMVTRNVQRVAETGANLDANLQAVRGKVMGEIVTAAANAPGDNRVAQAQQIQKIVEDTKAMRKIVEDAQQTNQQKFGAAKQMFSDARQQMNALGQSSA